MYFYEDGKRISRSDIHKSQEILNFDQLNQNSNRLCKEKCIQFKASGFGNGNRYASGQFRCNVCEIYLTEQGVTDNFRCKCCNFQVRSKPRNSFRKEMYHKTLENINKSQIEQKSDDKTTDDIVEQKKSTPIYEELDNSVKTYYEFKEFLESMMQLQANYQLVMLKELLEYGRLHKGEIADSLAYFNNKDSSDIDSVKYYLDVPVYDVLVNHGFVIVDNYNQIPHYTLNVKLTDMQKIELSSYLTNNIEKYNREHNIPDNEYPNANNVDSIDWDEYDVLLKNQKPQNIAPISNSLSSKSFWIWSVTLANWEILKDKNVWGSRVPKEKISQVVKSGDLVAFYVIGTNSFKGVYEFDSDWYDSPGKTWDDDLEPTGELRHKSQIKIIPVCIGIAKLSELHEQMELFKDKPANIRNLILQGAGGYPSNNQQSLTVDDFSIIIDELNNSDQTEYVPLKTQDQTDKNIQQTEEKERNSKSRWMKKLLGISNADAPITKKPMNESSLINQVESQDFKPMKIFESNNGSISITHCKVINTESIQKDQQLTNDDLMRIFGVGNMGGIRYSSKNNVIILCDTKSGHYDDKVDKDFQMIYYTGEGQKGDQTLTGGNQRIVNSENTPIFYFIEVPQEPGQKRRGALDNIYKFVGQVKYAKHVFKTENDINGSPRQVIKFLLEVKE